MTVRVADPFGPIPVRTLYSTRPRNGDGSPRGDTVEDLRRALGEDEGKKPTLRLTAAIAYENGVSQTELAEWYDVERRTMYSWLEREPLAEAARDDRRSGRPRKLGDRQPRRLEEALREPPTEAGYDAPTSRPALVRQYLVERFGVEYSRPSCRRLMKEAGLRYRRPRRTATETTPADGDRGDRMDEREGRWTPQ